MKSQLTAAETGRRSNALKHREDDDFRPVPMVSPVEDALRKHFERGYTLPDRTWASPRGTAHPDWGNTTNTYLRPALALVFKATKKEGLMTAPAGILRKTAITFWMENGIPEQQAADWAGHTGDVQRIYYASRSSADFRHEVLLLERGALRQTD